ncbi:MAG: heme exporter protein CcmB [bacterium]
MAFFSQAWAIVRKDLLTELRGASTIVSMVLLGLLVVLVFNFGADPGADSASLARSGVLWAAFLFSGVIAVGRSFASEKEAGCLDGLLLCPVDRGVIYLGKLIGNLILVFATGVVILLFFTVVYNVDIGAGWLGLLLLLVLASVGLSTLGTLFAAVAAGVRARDALLTVFIFPLLVPLVIAAAHTSTLLLAGQSLGEAGLWPWLLVVYDVVFLAVSFVVFDFVVED